MTTLQVVFSWIIGVNGACLTAVSFWKVIYHIEHVDNHPADIIPAGYHRAAYALAFMLGLILLVLVAIWDMAHPQQQFPYDVRMWFTIPVLLLADYAFIGRVWKPKTKK